MANTIWFEKILNKLSDDELEIFINTLENISNERIIKIIQKVRG